MQISPIQKPPSKHIQPIPNKDSLTDHGSIFGGIAWIFVAQYFVMIFVVQSAWDTPYSLVLNAISDLGAETCGTFSEREVCSPWHIAANISWGIAGISIFLGAILLWKTLARVRMAQIGLVLLMLSGIGLLTVGLNPEDTSPTLHVAGAMAGIFAALAGITVLGVALIQSSIWHGLGWIGVGLGTLGIVGAFLMLVADKRLFGLFERFAVYTWMIWIIAVGMVILRSGLSIHQNAGRDTGNT